MKIVKLRNNVKHTGFYTTEAIKDAKDTVGKIGSFNLETADDSETIIKRRGKHF